MIKTMRGKKTVLGRPRDFWHEMCDKCLSHHVMSDRFHFQSNWECKTNFSQDPLGRSTQGELQQLAAAEPQSLQSVHGWQSKCQLTWVHNKSKWQESQGEPDYYITFYKIITIMIWWYDLLWRVDHVFSFALSSVAGDGSWVYKDGRWASDCLGAAWIHRGEFLKREI